MAVIVQFKLIAPLLFAAFLLIHSIQATDVKYCGLINEYADKKGNYVVKVQGVEISPDPVVSGQPATFSISGYTGQAIPGGKLVIDVSVFGVHIHSETHDLCTETSCPISIGNFVLSHSQILPGFTPPGSYTLKMRMKDGSGQQLTCINFDFSIGSGLFMADS
ncbi:hypothetical protein HHK36_019424 [Tetracentron sinense]|uniref:MD-2-related lipid-recognition domain-containing protein n=1 Tax=Tetracentron sinense TaxID=13715 RepID=A0A835D953_TETSI|nr:hypothetical protein HHK36_019424 [Tetracentron sinense]